MGYTSDQEGIMRRHINEEGNWNSHLTNAKNFIIENAHSKKKNNVAILGSGWLLDVPIEFLSSNFKSVDLYDVCHPKQVKYKVGKYKNVHLKYIDLTGGAIQEIYKNRKQISNTGGKWLNKLKLNKDVSFHEYDYVISLNILNQLDIILADYLKSQLNIKEDILINLREKLQNFHINSLPRKRSCLISDIIEKSINKQGITTQKRNLLFADTSSLNIIKEWDWVFDTKNTYNEKYTTVFKVIAAIK